MSLEIRLRPEAEEDLEDAATWYEAQRKGLGQEFVDDILTALQTIAENPKLYPVVHRDTRRAVIHRFPFSIFYRTQDSTIIIVAIMHGSRHPRRWKERP